MTTGTRTATPLTPRSKHDGSEYLEVLARGLAVITAFGSERPRMGLAEVARAIGAPNATARRVLRTLQNLGYVALEGRQFRLTPNVLRLSGSYLVANRMTEAAKRACQAVVARIDEPCSMSVLEGSDIVMLATALPRRTVLRGPRLGLRLPAFCTAIGRVLLSSLDDRELDRFLASLSPVAFTDKTVTDKAELRRQILQARTAGYALVDQEQGYGFRSIAVPIRRFDGRIIAALQVGITIERASPQTMQQDFLPVLQEEAHGLREVLV
jgi:IclR family pca regulon transcriptional regulator